MSAPSSPFRRPAIVLALLCFGLAASLIGAILVGGAVPFSWRDLLPFAGQAPDSQALDLRRMALLDIRLPRVLFSAVAGAGLALAGAVMQALFRNPLAEPGLVGVSAGAALGAALAIVFVPGGQLVTMLAAFIGSLAALGLAYGLGSRYHDVAGLLLAGIGVNAVALSAIGLLIYVASSVQLRDVAFWTLGSLAGADWRILAWLGPWVLVCGLYLGTQWKVLNALLLGEKEALHLGYRFNTVRRRLIVAMALLVGPLVAVTGGIGFVGLIVPHILRLVLGAHHRHLLPASALAGALLLVVADWLARSAVSPAELPIGLLTSLAGGPFFFWLLWRHSAGRAS